MSTQLHEMFKDAANSEVPFDLADRATRAARQRRRQRFAVGALAATAAAVLGYVIVTSDARLGDESRPTEVASIPDSLPALDGLPRMEAGAMAAASVIYVVDGQVVFVDASTGDAAVQSFGPPIENGGTDDVLVPVIDVTLSPDGRQVAMTVDGWPRGEAPTVRVFDVQSATEQIVAGFTPVGDVGGVTLVRPSVYAWANDSRSFECACARTDLPAGSAVPRLYEVAVSGGPAAVSLSSAHADLSPVQVTAGTAGTFAREAGDGAWLPPESLAPRVEPIYAIALALGRGEQSTYIASEGVSAFTVGDLALPGSEIVVPGTRPTGGPILAIPTDVDSVTGGFVAVIADVPRLDESDAGYTTPAEAIRDLRAYYVTMDGRRRLFTTFPQGAITASFASDLVD